ncbi:MAG: hypothetical protein IJX98_04440 [Clostridia bacterium]|nr:hypothetical protein [Clostridia bacterium]
MGRVSNKYVAIGAIPFVITELAYWYIIIFVGGTAGVYVSFLSIVLACLFALVYADWGHLKRPTTFINLALLGTVAADYFLILQEDKLNGMICFSVVQLLYFAYLMATAKSKKERVTNIVVRAIAVFAAEAAMLAVLREKTDAVSALSLFYIANLAVNMLFAYAQGKKRLLFAIGLTLFLLCDLCVGLSSGYLPFPEGSFLHSIPFGGLVWVFYLPSQTLIPLHLAFENRKKVA